MLTRCVDKEYRDRGIHVVGLSPGTVATDMQRAIKASGINPVSRMDFSQHIPPEWPARAVAWLCTDAARRAEEHTSELQSLMRISYAVFCLHTKHTHDELTH